VIKEEEGEEGVVHVVMELLRGRGLLWFTFELNVSAFWGIGGALSVCLGVILRVFRRCRGDIGGCWGFPGCSSRQIRLRLS